MQYEFFKIKMKMICRKHYAILSITLQWFVVVIISLVFHQKIEISTQQNKNKRQYSQKLGMQIIFSIQFVSIYKYDVHSKSIPLLIKY